jgi:hypothetical protein
MLLFGAKVLSILVNDGEGIMASVAGSFTDSIVHKKNIKHMGFMLLRTLIVGYFLAVFVSPAISEKFNLSKSESVATSFVCGYAGIRLLSMADKILEAKVKKETSGST